LAVDKYLKQERSTGPARVPLGYLAACNQSAPTSGGTRQPKKRCSNSKRPANVRWFGPFGCWQHAPQWSGTSEALPQLDERHSATSAWHDGDGSPGQTSMASNSIQAFQPKASCAVCVKVPKHNVFVMRHYPLSTAFAAPTMCVMKLGYRNKRRNMPRDVGR